MAKSTHISTTPQRTYAEVDDWVGKTHQCLLDVGCIQTQDVGQYEVDTLTGAVAAKQVIGYRMYEINDQYSNDQPIYFKIEFKIEGYGTNNAILAGSFVVSTGFQTDLSGGFVGSYITPIQLSYGNTTQSSAGITYNASGGRNIASKGPGYFFLGGLLGLGYQSLYNNIHAGLFGIVRSKNEDGSVNFNDYTFIYGGGTGHVSSSAGQSLSAIRNSVLEGVSLPTTDITSLPNAQTNKGSTVATCADISAANAIEVTDRLLCIRTLGVTSGWSTYDLSLDGLTSHTYLQIPTFLSGTNSSTGHVPIPFVADKRNPGIGAICIIWD